MKKIHPGPEKFTYTWQRLLQDIGDMPIDQLDKPVLVYVRGNKRKRKLLQISAVENVIQRVHPLSDPALKECINVYDGV